MMITNAVHKPQVVINGQLPLFQTEVLNRPVHDQLWLLSFYSAISLLWFDSHDSDTETVKTV